LQLEYLLVNELAAFVHDIVGVERAFFCGLSVRPLP
jgi:hypothetical protein